MIAGAVTRASLQTDAPLVHMDDGRARTGQELHERITSLANLLAAKGLAGRRIGAWYQNSFAVLEAHLAIEWIGATRVPVDPAAPAAEAKQVFDAAEVDLVVADSAHAAQAGGDVLIHDDDWPAGTPGALGTYTAGEDTILHWFPRAVSGGRLHGIPITYGNWEALLRNHEHLYRSGGYGPPITETECFLTAQQAMHGTSMIGTYPFLRMGLPQILLERFDATKALEAILRHNVTSTMFVPGMVTRLADLQPEQLSLKRLLYGGAPIDRADLLRSIDVFGDTLVQLYGRWEGGWPISILDGADHLRIKAQPDIPIASSAGKPIDAVEIKLRPVPGHEDQRELCVRSPMVVKAYADPDGWFALGDLARLDDGYLYLQGRLDGQISTGAYHVYPGEIEEALLALEPVREARVQGEPDPKWGEIVTAYVVAENATEEELRSALRTHLAPYKIPRQVHFVQTL